MTSTQKTTFHKELRTVIDEYVHGVYDCSQIFPKEELFGVTSQLRRAALSVALNYVEGYARKRKAVMKNFLEIAYGSLQESKYLIEFAYKRTYLDEATYIILEQKATRVGAMLWGMLIKMDA